MNALRRVDGHTHKERQIYKSSPVVKIYTFYRFFLSPGWRFLSLSRTTLEEKRMFGYSQIYISIRCTIEREEPGNQWKDALSPPRFIHLLLFDLSFLDYHLSLCLTKILGMKREAVYLVSSFAKARTTTERL